MLEYLKERKFQNVHRSYFRAGVVVHFTADFGTAEVCHYKTPYDPDSIETQEFVDGMDGPMTFTTGEGQTASFIAFIKSALTMGVSA